MELPASHAKSRYTSPFVFCGSLFMIPQCSMAQPENHYNHYQVIVIVQYFGAVGDCYHADLGDGIGINKSSDTADLCY